MYVHAHISTHLLIALTQILKKKSRIILSIQKLPLSNLPVTMVIITVIKRWIFPQPVSCQKFSFDEYIYHSSQKEGKR